jgi:hypothetical protein
MLLFREVTRCFYMLCRAQTPVSLHGIGLREAIEVGKRLTPDAMRHRVLLAGIEGRCFDLVGHPLTQEVAAAIGLAANEVIRCLKRLGGAGLPGAQTTRPGGWGERAEPGWRRHPPPDRHGVGHPRDPEDGHRDQHAGPQRDREAVNGSLGRITDVTQQNTAAAV